MISYRLPELYDSGSSSLISVFWEAVLRSSIWIESWERSRSGLDVVIIYLGIGGSSWSVLALFLLLVKK